MATVLNLRWYVIMCWTVAMAQMKYYVVSIWSVRSMVYSINVPDEG